MAKQTIRLYLILSFLDTVGLSLLMGTYVMFLRSRGLDLMQISVVNFMFHAATLCCEIPTGIIADVWGRKISYLTSCMLVAGGLFLYGDATSLWSFILAEVVVAIGRTCSSGAFDAWMVDRLDHFGYAEPLEGVYVRESVINRITMIVGSLLGWWIASIDITLMWHISGLLMLLNGIIALICMKEEYRVEQFSTIHASMQKLRAVVRESTEQMRSNTVIRLIVAMGCVLWFAMQGPNMQWQPFFKKEYFSTNSAFALVFAGMMCFALIGNLLASLAKQWMRTPIHSLVVAHVVIAVGLGVTAFSASLGWVLPAFAIHEIGRGFVDPIKQAYLNKQLPASVRATLQSFESMAYHIAGGAGLLISGAMAEYCSIRFTWKFCAITLLLGTFWLVRKHSKSS